MLGLGRGSQRRRRLSSIRMRQKVVCVIPEKGSLFETATPIGVWGDDRSRSTGVAIDFVACGVGRKRFEVEGGLRLAGVELLADHVETADMIVVPTWPIARRPVDRRLVELLIEGHERGARIVGLCLGAFAVAETGLLDGLRAVTHWRHRALFEERYPQVSFEPDTLYVDNDSVVTSAGSAAALDCCLHLVRRDHGAEAAALVARSMVTAPHRSGAQSQFASAPPITAGNDALSMGLARAAADIASVRSVEALADLVGTSRRSLERHIHARLGVTPKAWINEQRVITACRLLETTDLDVDHIAVEAGFGSTPTLRRVLREARNTTPTAYRAMFG